AESRAHCGSEERQVIADIILRQADPVCDGEADAGTEFQVRRHVRTGRGIRRRAVSRRYETFMPELVQSRVISNPGALVGVRHIVEALAQVESGDAPWEPIVVRDETRSANFGAIIAASSGIGQVALKRQVQHQLGYARWRR